MHKLIAVSIFIVVSLNAATGQAQDKSRAEVKAETRAAGVDGSKTADGATPGGKVVGGDSRAEVKAERGKVSGAESADGAQPVKKRAASTTRSWGKVDRSTVLTSETAEVPTPGPVRPAPWQKRKKAQGD